MDRNTRVRLLLFGIFIVLDVMVFFGGLKLPDLPAYASLQQLSGVVQNVTHRATSYSNSTEHYWLDITLANNPRLFRLGFSDFLDESSEAYRRAMNTLVPGIAVTIRVYAMQSKLTLESWFNIGELESNGTVLVRWEDMTSALAAENRFNYWMFFLLNLLVICGFVYLMLKSESGEEAVE